MADLTGKTLGNYEILALLGKGGMATVYRANQPSMKREVALKVIESERASEVEFIRRFEREVNTIAAFSHPHILKVFDFGQDQGVVYLVMELLKGGNLADKLREGGALPLKQVQKLLDQIASALDFAHRRGVVHRDMKPQNVMLDEDNNAFIADFGIAKVMSGTTTMTQTGAVMGTPAYMAPEQWKSQPVDARTDIYALGIILFEMLTGNLPFNADTAYGMMHKHVSEEPPLRTMDTRFAAGIERVILKALSKDPAERFSSAGEMAQAFAAAVERHGLTDSPYAPPLTADTEEVILVEIEDDPEKTHKLPPPVPLQPAASSTPAAAPPQARRSLLPLVLGAIAVLAAGGAFLAFSNSSGQSTGTAQALNTTATVVRQAALQTDVAGSRTATFTLTSTSPPQPPTATLTHTASATNTTVPTATLTPTNTDEPEPATQVAQTLAGRLTATALIVASYTKTPTPNRQQTAAAIVAAMDTATVEVATANAIASYTRTPTPTLTLTPTRTPTLTPSRTHTPTLTLTPTYTLTLTPTPEPCFVIASNAVTRVYVAPGRNRNVIRFLDSGTPYRVLAKAAAGDGSAWWRIQYPGVTSEAWVADEDVSELGDCAEVGTNAAQVAVAITASATRTALPASATPVPPTMTVARTATRTPTVAARASATRTTAASGTRGACTVSTTGANVRLYSEPNKNSIDLRRLVPNRTFQVLAQAIGPDGTRWWQVFQPNATAPEYWVLQSEVTTTGDCSAVPVKQP